MFRKFSTNGTPFDIDNHHETEEDILQASQQNNSKMESDSDDDISDEHKKQLMEEQTGLDNSGLTLLSSSKPHKQSSTHQHQSSPVSGKIVSNSAIMLLR